MQEELLAQSKEEGRRIVADAEAKRERMRVSLVSEMEEKAVDLASDILGRVFTAPVAQSIHAHLIDELIEEIGKSDGPRPELETETVEVVVPFPLTQTQRERLNTIFSSNRRRHTRFDCDWSSDVCSSDLRRACSSGDVARRRVAAAGLPRPRVGVARRARQAVGRAGLAARACPGQRRR